MDENDAMQNRSNDDVELSKSFDENSIIGKMKVGVSRILPNSLSKWLSPKVDVTNARRRRHEEIDSDDDNVAAVRRNSPATITTDSRYQTSQLSVPPPNKKKKTFTEILNRNTSDLYSPTATPSIGDRSNIVSSTLIEDVPHSRNVIQFNRYSSLENGQHATTAAAIASASNACVDESTHENYRYNNDEASSSQSRDKPTNLFTINNDSSVVNFSAHLQRAKSLFTNRSYLSPRLKNYRMRNPRSSLYRSTSSLCDNNSVSSNASSVMSSPFYNGQTTFGGASATSRRMSTATTADIQMHHRPKVPTNLVTSRSTSSLNTIGGTSTSASMSTTAKRILDVMSKYNTPLTEVRRISNALPSIAETSAINKRKSILELEMTNTTNDNDKSKRTLLKPNTPYNRPFGRNPVESALIAELHVPSMPELLQLKKFATNTVKIRDIANKSDNILNRPVSSVATEFKLSTTTTATATTTTKSGSKTNNRATVDLDASNNNKFVNNKNDTISKKKPTSANNANKEHRNKIRNNLTKRNLGKRAGNDDAMPEPVNLPKISLVLDKKAEIKFSDQLKLPNVTDQKFNIDNSGLDNGPQIPFKFKTSNTNAIITSAAKECKRANGNSSENLKKFGISPTKPALSTSLSSSSTAASFDTYISTDLTYKTQLAQKISSDPTSIYRFNEPIIVKTMAPNSFDRSTNSFGDINTNYKFSDPIYVTDDTSNELLKNDTSKKFGNFKFDTKQVKGIPSDSGIADTQSSFGSNFSKSTVKPTMTASTISELGKSTPSYSTQLKEDDTFKSLVAKQKQGKWSCKDCFASNESTVNKCVCCGSAKNDEVTTKATVKTIQSQPATVADDVFKSIVTKQKQSKWECKDCMAQNNQTESKCLCCGSANPNASSTNVTDSKPVPTKPSFSFGALPSSSTSNTSAASNQPIDSVLRSIDDKQKSTWECSACLSANDVSKSKCACCEQSRDVTKGATTSGTVPTKSQISFGNFASVKTNPTAQYSFGNLKNSESATKTNTSINDGKTETENAKESSVQKKLEKAPATPTQFSFGKSPDLPSTSRNETTSTRLEVASTTTDNIFKSIVEKQKSSSWDCSACMAKNSNNNVKCLCCESSKDGNAPKDQEKKELVSGTQSISGSSKFSFGSKPENKTSFQFGTSSSSTTAPTTSLSSTTTATPIASSTTSNLFGSSQASTFSFTANEPSTMSVLGGFKSGLSPLAASTFGSKELLKDETDGTSSTSNNKGITVLDNVLVKPAASTNGPTESTPTPKFIFGQAFATQSTNDPAKARKRPSSESSDNNVLTKFPVTTSASSASTSFIFGSPQNTTNTNTFSAIASNPTTNLSQVSSTTTSITQKTSTFAFSENKLALTNAFANVQPSISFNPASNPTSSSTESSRPFANANSAVFSGNAFSSQQTPLNTAQSVFGSSIFAQPAATQPAFSMGGFKAGSIFGSSTTAFGTSTLNTAAQPQVTPSPATPGLFQFNASNNNQSASLSSEPPKVGGFNFSLATPPTYNFSEQSTQQANVPFQFGAPTDAPNMFAAQPANAAAIQQRRKIRPIRRVNRPSTQF